MWEKFLSNPILLALVAATCYGIGSPIMKIAGQNGASANGILFMYGVGALIFSLGTARASPIVYGSNYGLIFSLLVGFMMAVAFRCLGQAFSLKTGYITVVGGLVATYPMLASLIEIFLMGQAKHFNIGLAIGGVSMIIGGCFMLILCTKS